MTATSGPRGRIGHTFCASEDGHRAFIYGGLSANDDVAPNYLEDFWEYDVRTKTWKDVELTGSVQSPRAFHTTVWFGGRMYVFGGCNGRGRFNKLFYIEPSGLCVVPLLTGSLPTTRYCHSAVIYNEAMYVYGGKCGGRNSNRRLNDLYMLRFISEDRGLKWMKCEQHGAIPDARSAHSAVVHRNSMLIFGGRNGSGNCCDDVHAFNFQTCGWRRYNLDASPFGRARNSCVTHDGYAVLFGGWNGRRKLNDLIFFHMDSATVEKTDQLFPSLRECQVAVMCKDTMVVFGGRLKSEFMSETLELKLSTPNMVDGIMDFLSSRNIILNQEQCGALSTRLQQAYAVHREQSEGPEDISTVSIPQDAMSTDSLGPEIAGNMEGGVEEN